MLFANTTMYSEVLMMFHFASSLEHCDTQVRNRDPVVLWVHSTALTPDPCGHRGKVRFETYRARIYSVENLSFIMSTKGMVCITAQSQEKFSPVRNLMSNGVYTIINAPYIFFFFLWMLHK